MEDEVPYSTVVFNRFDDEKPEAVEPVEEVVYSEVKKNTEATTQSSPETVSASSVALLEEMSASHTASYKWATACLGLLCVLLLAGVVAMSVYNILHVSQYSEVLVLYNNESMALKRVQAEKEVVEKEKEALVLQKDQLSSILRSIIQFSNFPVHTFCQLTNGEIHCEPCMKNWIQNGSSCYLFSTEIYWNTWIDSQNHCTEMGGDLAVIDTIEEQEFIMQHTPYYYDEYHGYWIGLHKKDNMWVWTTGNPLEKGFWIDAARQSDGECVLLKPNSVTQASWKANSCRMYNKWVCEMKVLNWPSKI